MTDILSSNTGARWVVGHSPQNDENDVRIYESGREMALGTRFNWSIDRFDFQ